MEVRYVSVADPDRVINRKVGMGRVRPTPRHGGRLIMIPLHEPPDHAERLIAELRLSISAWDRGWHALAPGEIVNLQCGAVAWCKLHTATEKPLVKLRKTRLGGEDWHGGQCPVCGAVLVCADPERRCER